MDASFDVGSFSVFGQLLSDADVRFTEFAYACWLERNGDPRAKAFVGFFEAVEKKDSASADKILRRWGIRR